MFWKKSSLEININRQQIFMEAIDTHVGGKKQIC